VTAAMHERNGAGLGGQDLHVHTTMSDGTVSLERIVELARDRGVAVGVADHISTRTPTRMVATDAALQRYLDALEREPVFVAGEFCWCDRLSTSLPPEILRRFDYRIGSNHGFALPDGTEGSPWWETLPPPWDRRPQEVMEIMVHNLCDMVRTMDIQIAAHATLTPPALLAIEPALEHWWTEPREDRFVEALARAASRSRSPTVTACRTTGCSGRASRRGSASRWGATPTTSTRWRGSTGPWRPPGASGSPRTTCSCRSGKESPECPVLGAE
jgi:hypothetical protein